MQFATCFFTKKPDLSQAQTGFGFACKASVERVKKEDAVQKQGMIRLRAKNN